MKFKDYYDGACAQLLADKITPVYPKFRAADFVAYIEAHIGGDKEFSARQDIFATALELFLTSGYRDNLDILRQILGPELAQPAGMFSEGWWLWPVGRYVERHGVLDLEASLAFIYELTKRFTGEFVVRPLLEKDPVRTMQIMEHWSLDGNVHVRRLASEGLRVRLPWARKIYVALEHFDVYRRILTNLKNDPEKFVQKSVGNNLNDLYKEDPAQALAIIDAWQQDDPGKATLWIIKHGLRSRK